MVLNIIMFFEVITAILETFHYDKNISVLCLQWHYPKNVKFLNNVLEHWILAKKKCLFFVVGVVSKIQNQ